LTSTLTPTATPTSTPPPLPFEVFTHQLIRPGNIPQSYISNPCEYLSLRWSPERSTPGTVVIPVMFHGVREAGKSVVEGDITTITEEQFNMFVDYAKRFGYETITTAQLYDFLLTNARIPARSMLLIVDDRRPGTVETYFLPVAEKNDWTITLSWLIGNTDDELWAWMERLNATGRLDVQSHGNGTLYIVEQTPEEEIRHELLDPIPLIEEHFGKRPLAIVWPGGNFTPLAVAIAREGGYQLGFTAFSRGPVMFNWIPQGPEERAVADPLMTLPRFWSTDVTLSLQTGDKVGDAAQSAALENFPAEAEYYRTYCGGELTPPADIP
jgi:peptidoglycan/xylan/chitin deacetylase (PgdA/CDA1 family)